MTQNIRNPFLQSFVSCLQSKECVSFTSGKHSTMAFWTGPVIVILLLGPIKFALNLPQSIEITALNSNITLNNSNPEKLKSDFFHLVNGEDRLQFRMGFMASKGNLNVDCSYRSSANDRLEIPTNFTTRKQIQLQILGDLYLVDVVIVWDSVVLICDQPINQPHLILNHLNGHWNCAGLLRKKGEIEDSLVLKRNLLGKNFHLEVFAQLRGAVVGMAREGSREKLTDFYLKIFSFCAPNRSSITLALLWPVLWLGLVGIVVLTVLLKIKMAQKSLNIIRPVLQ